MYMRLSILAVVAVVVGCTSASPRGDAVSAARASDRAANRAADVALSMVGRPYRYAGNTPSGFDCSGLVSYSYARAGLDVARDTRALRESTLRIATDALRRGDLVFFDQEGKKASHVGIYLGSDRFVHAPSSGGRVRTDRLSADYWRRHFVEARRI